MDKNFKVRAVIIALGLSVLIRSESSLAQASPKLTVSPSSVSFSSTPSGTTSAPKALTLKNSGTGTLQISAVSIGGDQASEFSITNGCSEALAANSTCTISVTFRPTAEGARAASLVIKSNVADRAISLRGTGAAPPKPTLTLSPTSVSFSSTVTGTSSETKTVSVRNTGKGTLQISTITVVGTNPTDFASTNTCGSPVAPGGDCTISVSFSPSAAGARSATIEIKGNVATKSLNLRGAGTAPPKPVLSLSPTSVTFSGTPAWSTSTERRVTLRNRGSAPLEVSTITLRGEDASEFLITNTCGAPIAPSGNCVIAVSFRPKTIGSKSAFVEIKGNVAPTSLTLLGTATAPRNHKISTTVSGPGTISPASLTVTAGGTGTFTLSPQSGYRPVVTGCNGVLAPKEGGLRYTTGVITAPCTVSASFETIVYYNEIKNAIPSLGLYYEKTCRNTAQVYLLPSIDINNDRLKDLLLMLWCENNSTVRNANPSKNIIVALVQNGDGTFRLGNQEIFGKDEISLHGVLAEHFDAGLGDFNNDGKHDIALSPTLEDGRFFVVYEDGRNNWDSYPYVFLSQPDGTYKLEQLPYKGTLNSILIIRENNVDKFATGENIFYYENKKWNIEKLSSRNYTIDTTTVFFENNIVTQVFNDEKMGIKVGLNSSESFSQKDFYEISKLRKVQVYESSTLGDYTFSLANIDGIDWVMPALPTSCSISIPNGEILYFVDFQGIKLTEKYTGQRLAWTTPGKNGNVTWDNYYTKVLAFKVSGNKITKLDSAVFQNEYKTTYGLSCMDINADNEKDVVLYRWGHNQEKPVIWLNNNSSFRIVSEGKIPNISNIWHGHHSLITDLDGDNKADFIYSPGLGYKPDYSGLYDDYQIFRAVTVLE